MLTQATQHLSEYSTHQHGWIHVPEAFKLRPISKSGTSQHLLYVQCLGSVLSSAAR